MTFRRLMRKKKEKGFFTSRRGVLSQARAKITPIRSSLDVKEGLMTPA